MNKQMLVDSISERSGLSKKDSESVLNATIESIVSAVASNDKVQIIGFGSFEKHHRNARAGHNPKNGTPIQIEATDVPVFKAGTAFKNAVK